MKNIFILTISAVMLSACGTTSVLKANDTEASSAKLDFAKYDAVFLVPFADGTASQNLPDNASAQFINALAIEIRKIDVFDVVTTQEPQLDGKAALSLGGTIDRYDTGDAALRTIVGFGAGSSYFDATVTISDKESGEQLGSFTVDKNSSPLGGLIAGAQSTNNFMSGAAKKIAKELEDAKDD